MAAVGESKYKIVLLGEGAVGKTSILLKYCHDMFDEHRQPSMDASYMEKRIVVNGAPVSLSIWDTAGQERFHALAPLYYRDADGAVLVYDITDYRSFEKAQHWVRELQRMAPEGIKITLAGNKCDREKSRAVSREEASKFARGCGAEVSYTSAKTGEGIEACFSGLAQRLMAAAPGRGAGAAGGEVMGSGGGGRRGRRGRGSRRSLGGGLGGASPSGAGGGVGAGAGAGAGGSGRRGRGGRGPGRIVVVDDDGPVAPAPAGSGCCG